MIQCAAWASEHPWLFVWVACCVINCTGRVAVALVDAVARILTIPESKA